MPKISRHSYDIAIVAIRRDHTSGVSVLKVYQPWSQQNDINCVLLPMTAQLGNVDRQAVLLSDES